MLYFYRDREAMEIGVSLAGYDGFFSYVDLMIWQAETSDEDLRNVFGRYERGHA